MGFNVSLVECNILGCKPRFSWKLLKEEFHFLSFQTKRCLPKVKVIPLSLIMITLFLLQIMRRYWRIWTKRKWLVFIVWRLFAILMFVFIHLRWGQDRKICGPNFWCLKHLNYSACHTTFIQDFDQLHFATNWWIGGSNSPHNLSPCITYMWAFYFIFRLWIKILILSSSSRVEGFIILVIVLGLGFRVYFSILVSISSFRV